MSRPDTRAITLTLALSTAATGPQFLALSLLMPDMSQALNTPISLLGQLNTIFSIVAIIISLAMGLLTVKYSPKSLLNVGIATLLIGIIGTTVSPSYAILIVFFLFYGAGFGIVIPIANVLVALFPEKQRTSAMGMVYSGRSFASIIAMPIIGFLTAAYGWRVGCIGFGLPLIALTGAMVLLKIPNQPKQNETVDLTKGFKDIRASKSATACLIAAILALVFFNSLMVYNGAFLRNSLGFSIQTASIIMSITFIAIAIGQLTAGALTNRIGVKTVTYLATLICGVSFLAYLSLNLSPTAAIIASIIGTAAAGTTMTTMSILALDQTESQGTMMSLVNAAVSLGAMLG
jgi:DHA1 family inner membrane transport protein